LHADYIRCRAIDSGDQEAANGAAKLIAKLDRAEQLDPRRCYVARVPL